MKTLIIKQLILISVGFLLSSCVTHEKVSSNQTQEKTAQRDGTILKTRYGQHTDEIEAILSASPMGAEIYLEQKESGEWYLKIEKTFTAKKYEEKTKIAEPIYAESILI